MLKPRPGYVPDEKKIAACMQRVKANLEALVEGHFHPQINILSFVSAVVIPYLLKSLLSIAVNTFMFFSEKKSNIFRKLHYCISDQRELRVE